MPYRVTILVAALLLVGCPGQPERIAVPVAVEVPGPTQYVPLPAEATDDCGAAPELVDGMSNGELLEAAHAWRARARCRDTQVESIRRLHSSS